MLHKDPDHKSYKTGHYAKQLLERFIKEQPRNSYEKVFGSSSTVIAAAQIAHYHGADIENIEKLLHNPGSTQQRLTRIGGPHGGGGLGIPEPLLHDYRPQKRDDTSNDQSEEAQKRSSPYSDSNIKSRNISPYNNNNALNNNQDQQKEKSHRRSSSPRKAALPVFRKKGEKRISSYSPPKTTTYPTSVVKKSLLAASGGARGVKSTKHITIVQVQTPQEREASQRKKIPGLSERPFFCKENLIKVSENVTHSEDGKSSSMPDEEILSTLVSSALHVNPVVDEQHLNSPEDMSPESSRQNSPMEFDDLSNNNKKRESTEKPMNKIKAALMMGSSCENEKDNNDDDADGNDDAVSNQSSTMMKKSSAHLEDENNKKVIRASDRINLEVQSYFRELGDMFSFERNYTTAAQQHQMHMSVINPGSSYRRPSLTGGSGGAGQPPVDQTKLHLFPPLNTSQQVLQDPPAPPTTTATTTQNNQKNFGETFTAADVASEQQNNNIDSPGVLFASMVPHRGSRENSFSNILQLESQQQQHHSELMFSNNNNNNNNEENASPASGAVASLSPLRINQQQQSSGDPQQHLSPAARVPAPTTTATTQQLRQTQEQFAAFFSSVAKGDHHHNHQNNKHIRLPVELCIQSIELIFPQMKISTAIQQALVCDEMVEDLYYNSEASNADDSEPDASRGTITMRETEDLLFTSNEAALDLFLFLGAYDPQATTQPLAMPENIDGMETTIKLRQRLSVLNKRFDHLYQKVNEMLKEQILNDADVEVNAMHEYQKARAKKLAKMGITSPTKGADAGLELGGGAGGDSGAGGGSSSNSANQHHHQHASAQELALTKTAEDEGPLPFSMKVANAINCFEVQQLVLPITRLCEFEIIPWSLMDIYISVLFPTWADLGFVSMYSKTPPLLDFEEFATLLSVHRLVLHRREEQVKSVRRLPISSQPSTPWMPIVQRRVMRQTIFVAQMAKKGRMLARSGSSMSASHAGSSSHHHLSTGSSHHNLLGQSSALNNSTNSAMTTSRVGADASSYNLLGESMNHLSVSAGLASAVSHHNLNRRSSTHSSNIQRAESMHSSTAGTSSVHDQHNTNKNSSSSSVKQQHLHVSKNNSTPPSNSRAESTSASVQSTYLSLPLDDGTEGGGAGARRGVDHDDDYADLMDEDDENRIAMEKSEQMLDQIHDIHFKPRPMMDPPQHLVGVAPKWPDDQPRSWMEKWQKKMSKVKPRCLHTEPTDPEKPLSYKKLPLYDEWDAPLYEGPQELNREYAERLEAAGPAPFAVRKIERSLGTDVPRFDKNLRPSTAQHWRRPKDRTTDSGIDRGGLRPVKPLTTLRSGLYWFCAEKKEEKRTEDELELERIREKDPLEFERKMREAKKLMSNQYEDEEEEEEDIISDTDSDEEEEEEDDEEHDVAFGDTVSSLKSQQAKKKKKMKNKQMKSRKHKNANDDDENGIYNDDDDDDDDVPEVESNGSSTDTRFDHLREEQKRKSSRSPPKLSKAERRRIKQRKDEAKARAMEHEEFLNTRPRTAPRKPFCSAAKTHVPCHPPPPSSYSVCPDTRPSSAQYRQREIDFRRGYNSHDDVDRRPASPTSPEHLQSTQESANNTNNNKNNNNNDEEEFGFTQTLNSETAKTMEQQQNPQNNKKKPLVIRHWSEITSETLKSAGGSQNIVYQPDLAIAGKNSRPSTAKNSSRDARNHFSPNLASLVPSRPTTAASSARPSRPTTAASSRQKQISQAYGTAPSNNHPQQPSFSRPQTARYLFSSNNNNSDKHHHKQAQQNFTGFHKMIHASDEIVNGTHDSRVAEFLHTTQTNSSRGGLPIPLRHPSAGSQRNQYAPPSCSSTSSTTQHPLQTPREEFVTNDYSASPSRSQSPTTNKTTKTTAQVLKEQYRSEVKIPNLTLDQSSSFHRLLNEAKKEAEQRVAQQRLLEVQIREREKEKEKQRLRHASPDQQQSQQTGNNEDLVNHEQPVTKKEQSQEEAEEFHNEVMSWYKQGFGATYMNLSPATRKRRSPTRN